MATPIPKFFLPPTETSLTSFSIGNDAYIDQNISVRASGSETSSPGSFPTTIRSPSAFTDFPEDEEPSMSLTDNELETFNLIYFIDSEALTPFGLLDRSKDAATGHYKWTERSRDTSLPAVHVRPNHTGADITFRVKLTKLITIYAHVPIHSWEFGTCDSRSVRAALQKGYFSLLRGDPRSIIVRPAMYPTPAMTIDDKPAVRSTAESGSRIKSINPVSASHQLPSPSIPALRPLPANSSSNQKLNNSSSNKLIAQIPTPTSNSPTYPVPRSKSSGNQLAVGHLPGSIPTPSVSQAVSGVTTPAHLLASEDSPDRDLPESILGSSRVTSRCSLSNESPSTERKVSSDDAEMSPMDSNTLVNTVWAACKFPSVIVVVLHSYGSKFVEYVNLSYWIQYLDDRVDAALALATQFLRDCSQFSLPPWFWPLMLRYVCIVIAYGLCLIITQPLPKHFSLVSVSCM